MQVRQRQQHASCCNKEHTKEDVAETTQSDMFGDSGRDRTERQKTGRQAERQRETERVISH